MNTHITWRINWLQWLWIILAIGLITINFWGGVSELMLRWDKQEEYSHGYMLPFVSGYFIWQQRGLIEKIEFSPSWIGFIVVLLALLVFIIGEISALFILIDYALIGVLLGVALTLMGFKAIKLVLIPILLLVFAIPLPYFLEAILSAELQLLSSELGVMFIRWCQIPVYLEGNVIDLGVYQLQVVEACSGLRYLFPLMGLGFICAYMFNVVLWKRILLFLTTIPITLFMNSLRIGITGLLVNQWGNAVAEGFLHDFEGWIIFVACMCILILEMILMVKISKTPKPLMEVFGLVENIPSNNVGTIKYRAISYPLVAVNMVLILTAIGIFSLDDRSEIIPKRKTFPQFPMQLSKWQGKQTVLEKNVLNILQVSDYISADYRTNEQPAPINFYVAYYASQRKGVSPHSPRVCIPGGGWQISAIERLQLDKLAVNRIVIKKDNYQQLVYYWFQQRGRKMANEYYMKWYLFNDALFLNRTDGALVRLTTPVLATESIEIADQRLQGFLQNLLPILPEYIPN